jgi:hypothetical protein
MGELGKSPSVSKGGPFVFLVGSDQPGLDATDPPGGSLPKARQRSVGESRQIAFVRAPESPDALRLAAAQDLYPRHEIDVVDADGTGDEEVLVRDVRASDLAWSPDGRQIAFRNSNFRITVADIASGRRHELEEGYEPDWQPVQ